MVPRRKLLAGGVLGSLLGALGAADGEPAAAPAAAAPQGADDEMQRIGRAIADLRAELHSQRQFLELDPIRDAQKTFLRSNGKFPDYIEVGTDVWLAVHDWHIRWQQPMTLARDASGRYTILLNPTLVVMRTDLLGGYVGQPYDAR